MVSLEQREFQRKYHQKQQQKRIVLRHLKEIPGIESELDLTFFGKEETDHYFGKKVNKKQILCLIHQENKNINAIHLNN